MTIVYKKASLSTLVLFSVLFAGCSLPSQSRPPADGRTWLIQSNELPPGWSVRTEKETTYKSSTYWVVTYVAEPNALNAAQEIVHGIMVFEREKDAVTLWREYYKRHSESSLLEELRNENYQVTEGLPYGYKYSSGAADQFVILCHTVSAARGQEGYMCEALTRYGNVFSVFSATIVADEVNTATQLGESDLLHGSEMVELLELIDEKFQRAGLGSK